jgi:SPP1 family predicted phage head-tail adaptor
MMQPGRLNKRVVIQQLVSGSPSKDSFGEPLQTWENFAEELWAAVEPVQGREFWAQQQVQSEVTVRVRIRYLSGVIADMRVVYGARILDIVSVIDPKERHEEMQLMCSEGVRNG